MSHIRRVSGIVKQKHRNDSLLNLYFFLIFDRVVSILKSLNDKHGEF